MLPDKDLKQLYDTIFSMPGMNDKVKLNLQVSRRNILLMSKAIERGIQCKDINGIQQGVIDVVPKESLEELTGIAEDILLKSGLSVMNEKLKSL